MLNSVSFSLPNQTHCICLVTMTELLGRSYLTPIACLLTLFPRCTQSSALALRVCTCTVCNQRLCTSCHALFPVSISHYTFIVASTKDQGVVSPFTFMDQPLLKLFTEERHVTSGSSDVHAHLHIVYAGSGTYVSLHTHTPCTHTRTHMHTHTNTHTCTHTHTHARAH